jgi:hypothetical protein
MAEKERQRQDLERMRAALDQKAQEARARAKEEALAAADRPQEEQSVRAKSSGHRKKTADKWNQ